MLAVRPTTLPLQRGRPGQEGDSGVPGQVWHQGGGHRRIKWPGSSCMKRPELPELEWPQPASSRTQWPAHSGPSSSPASERQKHSCRQPALPPGPQQQPGSLRSWNWLRTAASQTAPQQPGPVVAPGLFCLQAPPADFPSVFPSPPSPLPHPCRLAAKNDCPPRL